ncbi:hypothetical protein NL53_10990 [Vibrio variabilis]|uniref:Uncharacterized protein n=1 Tax=Vibrio variabilis TaxID=990271 RepID=A0ABR4YAR6_9VIBR|nr:hypothetical protein NL53_10990 [Vibrio variabilis]
MYLITIFQYYGVTLIYRHLLKTRKLPIFTIGMGGLFVKCNFIVKRSCIDIKKASNEAYI